MTTRERVLEAALSLMRERSAVSLDAVATGAGLSKPGLMHHFRTKEALMLGLVDHVVDRTERRLLDHLGRPMEQVSVYERLGAYVELAVNGGADESDLVMLSDPRLRGTLIARWTERMAPWCNLPPDLPAERRARMNTARLIADGAWFAGATRTFPLPDDERRYVRAIALRLLED